ncbi:MAG: hypothetical protein ACI8TP_000635 [Acidimicrobiales bacterium]|jgi:hypothetical protein
MSLGFSACGRSTEVTVETVVVGAGNAADSPADESTTVATTPPVDQVADLVITGDPLGTNWPLPVLRDTANSDALIAYGASGFPFAVYLDGENRVLTRTSGELGAEAIEVLWLATAES